MRFSLAKSPELGETEVSLSSSCYTDSLPLLRRLIFRKQPIDTNTQGFALATAILLAGYCGEHFEFSDKVIGMDYGEAIRLILGTNTHIASVNGHQRNLSTREFDVASSTPESNFSVSPSQRQQSGVPLSAITWSSDFVDRSSRHSKEHQTGMYFTNANFFADPTTVSIALALIHGADRVGTVYVQMPQGGPTEHLTAIANGLRVVSISLAFVG